MSDSSERLLLFPWDPYPTFNSTSIFLPAHSLWTASAALNTFGFGASLGSSRLGAGDQNQDLIHLGKCSTTEPIQALETFL